MGKYEYKSAESLYHALELLPKEEKDEFFRKCADEFFNPADDIIIRDITSTCDYNCDTCDLEDKAMCRREMREGLGFCFAMIEHLHRKLTLVGEGVDVVDRIETMREKEEEQASTPVPNDGGMYG